MFGTDLARMFLALALVCPRQD